jgi:hypothetical protein
MTESKQGWFKAAQSQNPCPEADVLWGFSNGELASDRRDAIKSHLIECAWCCEKIARFGEVAGNKACEEAPVPPSLDQKLRAHWTKPMLQRIWVSQGLWAVLFIVSMTISFADSRHYKQWLVMALVTGARWALSERAARYQITVSQRRDAPAGGTKNRVQSVSESDPGTSHKNRL